MAANDTVCEFLLRTDVNLSFISVHNVPNNKHNKMVIGSCSATLRRDINTTSRYQFPASTWQLATTISTCYSVINWTTYTKHESNIHDAAKTFHDENCNFSEAIQCSIEGLFATSLRILNNQSNYEFQQRVLANRKPRCAYDKSPNK